MTDNTQQRTPTYSNRVNEWLRWPCSFIFEVSQEWIKKKVKLNIQKDYVLSLYFIISVYMFLFTLTFVLIYYGICSYYNTKFPDYSSTENSYFSHIFFTNTLTLSLFLSPSLSLHTCTWKLHLYTSTVMLNFIQGMYMPCHITIQHKILTVDALMQKHNLIYANLKWPLLQVLYFPIQDILYQQYCSSLEVILII